MCHSATKTASLSLRCGSTTCSWKTLVSVDFRKCIATKSPTSAINEGCLSTPWCKGDAGKEQINSEVGWVTKVQFHYASPALVTDASCPTSSSSYHPINPGIQHIGRKRARSSIKWSLPRQHWEEPISKYRKSCLPSPHETEKQNHI